MTFDIEVDDQLVFDAFLHRFLQSRDLLATETVAAGRTGKHTLGSLGSSLVLGQRTEVDRGF